MSNKDIPKLESVPPKKGEIYKHYKGNLYEVVFMALHSDGDMLVVIYKPLYEVKGVEYFARPLSEWKDKVILDDKETERFKLVV